VSGDCHDIEPGREGSFAGTRYLLDGVRTAPLAALAKALRGDPGHSPT
jgi:hypothetical protein